LADGGWLESCGGLEMGVASGQWLVGGRAAANGHGRRLEMGAASGQWLTRYAEWKVSD